MAIQSLEPTKISIRLSYSPGNCSDIFIPVNIVFKNIPVFVFKLTIFGVKWVSPKTKSDIQNVWGHNVL